MAACGSKHHGLNLWGWLLLQLLLLLPRDTQPQTAQPMPRVNVTPKTLAIHTLEQIQQNVRVSCGSPDPADGRVDSIISLVIERMLEEARPGLANPQRLVKATVRGAPDRDAKLVANGGLANWTVRGEVSLINSVSSIQVTILRAGCWDAGLYTCVLQYEASGGRAEDMTATTSTYLSVSASGPMLNVTPSFASSKVEEGSVYNITCSANVGSKTDAPFRTEWMWEYRDTSTASKQWKEYEGAESDVTEPFPPLKESCFERRYTQLSRRLTEEDSTRDYRCFLRRRLSSSAFQDWTDQALVVTIPNFLEKPPLRLGHLGIVGIVFGLLAMLCAGGFACFFYRRRQRRLHQTSQEVAQIQRDIDETRKSLASVLEKRKSLHKGGKAEEEKLDRYLNKLGPMVPASDLRVQDNTSRGSSDDLSTTDATSEVSDTAATDGEEEEEEEE